MPHLSRSEGPYLALEPDIMQIKNITSNQIERRMRVSWSVVLFSCLCSFAFVTPIECSDITTAVFGNVLDGMPAAFGDFNSDELIDVFVLRNSSKVVEIFLASDQEPLLNSNGLSCKFSDRVTNVVPGDFDGDLFMDVMVTTRDASDITKVWILWNDNNILNCTNNFTIEGLKGQPLALDYNYDMITDLFGLNNTNQKKTFWIFNNTRTSPRPVIMESRKVDNLPPIADPHSNAFLDLNKDYAPDLVITRNSSYFEIWHSKTPKHEEGFEFFKEVNFFKTMPNPPPTKIGQMLFLDMDLTGEMNLLLPVCFTNDNCTIMYAQTNGEVRNLNVKFKNGSVSWCFPETDEQLYTNTITLRSGDFDMDGYVDLLATLESTATPNFRRSFLLRNKLDDETGKRTFEVDWGALEPFHNETVMAVFYDFYQDGFLDVILVESKDKAKELYRTVAFRNSDYDANFVKVMVMTTLNDFSSSWRKKKTSYVTNLPGPSIAYKITTQDGYPRSAIAAQLPQSAYFSLNLPYTIFGLNRTPNFIDVLTVGVGGENRGFFQVIPNSQMVVIPDPLHNPAKWKYLLFITPSKLILLSAAALMGVCCLISVIIMGLYWKERRDDKKEKLQEAHRFHFDAM